MNLASKFSVREGRNELFVTAPGDELHKAAFTTVAPGSTYDSVLEEWRVPWDGIDVEALIGEIENSANRLASEPVSVQVTSKRRLLLGYAQTTIGEPPEIQIDALRTVGISDEWIFYDRVSGRYPSCPKLVQCLDLLEPGDTLVVHSINRLARSLKQLADTAGVIKDKNAHILSLSEPIDTSKPEYEHFVEHIAFAAAFEISANSARTKAGLKEAVARGRKGGGRRRVLTPEKLDLFGRLVITETPTEDIAKIVGASRATLYRAIPGGITAIREAYKLEGEEGVKRILDAAKIEVNLGVTDELREAILRYDSQGKTVTWIMEQTNFNRETIRRVIQEATT